MPLTVTRLLVVVTEGVFAGGSRAGVVVLTAATTAREDGVSAARTGRSASTGDAPAPFAISHSISSGPAWRGHYRDKAVAQLLQQAHGGYSLVHVVERLERVA